jgi:DNA-binding MarR family transcriptional regulator
METANYITRVTNPDDNRKTIVKLTSDGYKFDEEIRACFRIVENKMIQNITKEELDYFSKILDKMDENLHKEKETNYNA